MNTRIIILTVACFTNILASAVIKHSSTSAHTTINNTILCGYQGWHAASSDGSNLSWKHYEVSVGSSSYFEPGACHIDFWPDMREYDSDEQFQTPFTMPDGSKATVYSSYKLKSVVRHFRWMEEYGIDGVILQRFVTNIRSSSSGELKIRNFNDSVLNHVKTATKMYNRSYCVMYDMSGMSNADTANVIKDWKHLVDGLGVTTGGSSQSYLYHKGKPVVCLWGAGFDDGRHDPTSSPYYSLAAIGKLIRFFKNDPVYGQCTVLLGVNFSFRTKTGNPNIDDSLFSIIKQCDIIQPWLVGRLKTISDVTGTYQSSVYADLQWCKSNNVEYMPCAFPGFSWYNMNIRDFVHTPTPRLGGNFLWRQFQTAIQQGAKQIYATMFDEVDEGTAMYKTTDTPPNNINNNNLPIVSRVGSVPPSLFQTMEGLPSDHYLWLIGEASRMLRGEVGISTTLPTRSNSVGLSVLVKYEYTGVNQYGIYYQGTLPLNNRLYYSNPYVVAYGAPTIGKTRDNKYFASELPAVGAMVTVQPGKIITFVQVDANDKVVAYGSMLISTNTAVPVLQSESHIRIFYENRSQMITILPENEIKDCSNVIIRDMKGSIIIHKQVGPIQNPLRLSVQLSKGLYIIQFLNKEYNFNQKLLIN